MAAGDATEQEGSTKRKRSQSPRTSPASTPSKTQKSRSPAKSPLTKVGSSSKRKTTSPKNTSAKAAPPSKSPTKKTVVPKKGINTKSTSRNTTTMAKQIEASEKRQTEALEDMVMVVKDAVKVPKKEMSANAKWLDVKSTEMDRMDMPVGSISVYINM